MIKSIFNKITTIAVLGAVVIFGASQAAQAAATAGVTAAMVGEPSSTMLAGTPLSGVTLAMNNALKMAATGQSTVDISAISAAGEVTGPDPVTIPDARDFLDYSTAVVSQVNDYVNIRSMPSEEGEILGKLYNKCVGTMLGEENGWVLIKSGTVEGYVSSDYVVIADEALIDSVSHYRAKVIADALKLRAEPNTECAVYDVAWNGEKLEVLDDSLYSLGWLYIKRGDREAYVAAEFVELAYEFDCAESKAEEEARLAAEARARDASMSSIGVRVANYALQFVGNPYVWGGTSLTRGADCSGFILSVYRNFGVSLPHSSYADRSVGRGVSTSEMRPGDIICYSGHVALYIGNGQIVHAASRRSGIKVSNAFYRNILAVRRIF